MPNIYVTQHGLPGGETPLIASDPEPGEFTHTSRPGLPHSLMSKSGSTIFIIMSTPPPQRLALQYIHGKDG